MARRDLVEKTLRENGIEFRRGLSGGGSQLKQPYLKNILSINPDDFRNIEHVHHYSWYIGNYPTLTVTKINQLVDILNAI
jgi:CDP-6-deoxy-D-xylo-4-hexulose-3-dehydrase